MFQTFNINAETEKSAARLHLLRAALKTHEADGFIIPLSDEHMNEYLPPSARRLQWLTGFSGSAGVAIVLENTARLFVDGRYTLQAAQQTDPDAITVGHLIKCTPAQWLEDNLEAGDKLGFDPWLHTGKGVKNLEDACAKAGARLIACSPNPIDQIWADRPAPPCEKITMHPLEYAGEPASEKLEKIRQKLRKTSADALMLTLTDSIAWAFNIRGNDIEHNPITLAFAIILANGKSKLFINPEKLTSSTSDYLTPLTKLTDPGDLIEELKKLGVKNKKVQIDRATCPHAIAKRLEDSGASIIDNPDPCIPLKAIKNKVEQDGARAAHIRDGAALSRFLCWLDKTAPGGQVSEISAVKTLESLRADTGKLKDISFDTISGAGSNGAIVHYRVSEKSNSMLRNGELYLVDSGGQYEDGTTDVTRTIAIGTPPPRAIRHFTLVLKGHIALARARFPKSTTGAQLDVLARDALWRSGLDYDHGTGHGVGSYLSVHEGPQGISKRSHVALEPGMILSNEPGFYRTGEYGIRIENLMLVHEPADIEGGETPMLGFETLTFAPIDANLIDPALLNGDEKAWLNAYHQRVRETLTPLLPEDDKNWLREATKLL